MGIVTAEMVKSIASEIYDYKLTDDSARSIARGAGALLTGASRLGDVLDLREIEPPFGFANLEAEAARLRRSVK
jgi:hypothetical protein